MFQPYSRRPQSSKDIGLTASSAKNGVFEKLLVTTCRFRPAAFIRTPELILLNPQACGTLRHDLKQSGHISSRILSKALSDDAKV